MNFEWDENKNQSNIEKHGYDFRDVVQIFTNEDLLVYPSSFAWEERNVAISQFKGKYIALVYTARENVIRLISARRARKKEIKAYEQAKRKSR